MKEMKALLVIDFAREGAENMAVDMAMAQATGQGVLPLVIRLYSWMKPTLSLGRSQKLENVDLDFLKEEDIDLVKRPTGGMAILHESEITFCFCIPGPHPWNKLRSWEIHRKISQLLCEALRSFGVPAKIYDRKDNRRFPLCYATTSRSEITLYGKKLVGSAQYRTRKFVLQHGSIPLTLDIGKYLKCFKNHGLSSESLKNKIITLSEAGIDLNLENFAASIHKVMEKMNFEITISRSIPSNILEHAAKLKELYKLPLTFTAGNALPAQRGQE